jgi:hypothetical protein
MKKIESICSSTIDDLTLLFATKQPDKEIKHVFSVQPAPCFFIIFFELFAVKLIFQGEIVM